MELGGLTRRSFVKMAALTAAATGLVGATGGAALVQASEAPAEGEVRRVRTCCRGCGKMECGVWVTVENGRAVKVEGDVALLTLMMEHMDQFPVTATNPFNIVEP